MFCSMQITEWRVMKSLLQPCLDPSVPAIHSFKPLPARGHHDPKSVEARLKMQHVKILFDSSKYTGAKSINSLTKYRSQPIVELTQIKSISLANKMRRALISESLIKAVLFRALLWSSSIDLPQKDALGLSNQTSVTSLAPHLFLNKVKWIKN